MMQLGPGKLDQAATQSLGRVKIKAKNHGDLSSAAVSGAYYAKKLKQSMFVYSGNSYGHAVWRVSYKPGEYLSPINNTGSVVLEVTPQLEVWRHEVAR